MSIYFILKNSFPIGNASTARVISYCTGFVNNGAKCEVIIPIAPEPYGNVKNKTTQGVFKGIPFRYISGTPQRSKSLILRQLKDRIDYIKTLLFLLFSLKKGDCVIVYEGGCIWFSWLTFVAKIKKAKIVMELNELPYGTGKETSRKIKLRNRMLTTIFPKFDGFIAISESLSDLSKKYCPNGKVIKVPIIVDANITNGASKTYPQRPYIFHSGTLYEQKDGILGMIKAFAIANQKLGNPMDYVMTGSLDKSPEKEQIIELLNKYGIWEYVKFVGFLSETELRNYQNNCLLAIINKADNQQNKYCFSTKLGEYLAFAKPIIITNVGEAMYYLNENNAYIVEPNCIEQMVEKIIQIYNEPQPAKLKGEKGLELIESTFSNTLQTQRIISFLRDL